MTREEAIKEMIRAYDVLDFSCHMDNRRKEAFNMAKVALEQEPVYFPPCVDCNTKMNEIREAYDKLKPYKVKRAFKMGWEKGRVLMGGRCECGQYISDEDKYCRKCGKPLDWGAIFAEMEGKE